MNKTAPFLAWPLRGAPVCRNAGTYPMTVPPCNRPYQDSTVALHLHDYSGTIFFGKTRFQLEPGDVTLSPSGFTSRYELTESGSHLCIHFYPEKAGRLAERIRLPLHWRLGSRAGLARERMWRVIDYHWRSRENKATAESGAASASLQELLLWLHLQGNENQVPSRVSLQEQRLTQLRDTIDASLAQPFTVPELAEPMGLSTDYLSRLFRERYGMTIPRYTLLKRIELARHLLVSSDLPVQEVGRQSGIPDPQYFNKQFRRITGQSPRAYSRSRKKIN
jgi:AraC-like DNA-binding protein